MLKDDDLFCVVNCLKVGLQPLADQMKARLSLTPFGYANFIHVYTFDCEGTLPVVLQEIVILPAVNDARFFRQRIPDIKIFFTIICNPKKPNQSPEDYILDNLDTDFILQIEP